MIVQINGEKEKKYEQTSDQRRQKTTRYWWWGAASYETYHSLNADTEVVSVPGCSLIDVDMHGTSSV